MVDPVVLVPGDGGEGRPDVDTLEPFGLGWRWRWRKDRTWVQMTFRQIRKGSSGPNAEVTVEANMPLVGVKGCLTVERVTLSDGNGRVKLANRLEKRTGEGEGAFDWRNHLDAVCSAILVRGQQGPERIMIGAREEKVGNWLISNLIEERQTTSIYGDGEVGKSWLALAACVSAASGVEIIPGWVPARRMNPLYCDWETDAETLNHRVRMICRGAGIPYVEIAYLFMDGPLSEGVEWLLERCSDDNIQLVVIDSVEAAMQGSRSDGGDLNDAPGKVNQVLRKLARSTILVDHVNAASAQAKGLAGKAYGSVFKRNWTRAAFEVKRTHEGEVSNYAHLGIYCTKRNNGPRFDAKGLLWTINEQETDWRAEELTSADLQQALPVRKRMELALGEETPLGPQELADRCESKLGQIRTELSRNKSVFRKRPDGLIELVPANEPRSYPRALDDDDD